MHLHVEEEDNEVCEICLINNVLNDDKTSKSTLEFNCHLCEDPIETLSEDPECLSKLKGFYAHAPPMLTLLLK